MRKVAMHSKGITLNYFPCGRVKEDAPILNPNPPRTLRIGLR